MLVVLSTLVAVPGTARAAVPAAEPSAPIRYAATDDCDKDPRNAERCGPWWYRTTDGRRHRLALNADGRTVAVHRRARRSSATPRRAGSWRSGSIGQATPPCGWSGRSGFARRTPPNLECHALRPESDPFVGPGR
ncbi:hypothetical protein GCM10010486_17520 [Nonomuraea roseoviolacea subsp. carminata]